MVLCGGGGGVATTSSCSIHNSLSFWCYVAYAIPFVQNPKQNLRLHPHIQLWTKERETLSPVVTLGKFRFRPTLLFICNISFQFSCTHFHIVPLLSRPCSTVDIFKDSQSPVFPSWIRLSTSSIAKTKLWSGNRYCSKRIWMYRRWWSPSLLHIYTDVYKRQSWRGERLINYFGMTLLYIFTHLSLSLSLSFSLPPSACTLLSFCFACVCVCVRALASISIRQIPPPPAKKTWVSPTIPLLMSATTKKGTEH